MHEVTGKISRETHPIAGLLKRGRAGPLTGGFGKVKL